MGMVNVAERNGEKDNWVLIIEGVGTEEVVQSRVEAVSRVEDVAVTEDGIFCSSILIGYILNLYLLYLLLFCVN